MISGIYAIINIYNFRVYIGSAVDIKNRWRNHRDDLKCKKHGNVYLQGVFNKYGLKELLFVLIEECKKESLLEREQFWIDSLETVAPLGYNILPIAGSRLGSKHSDNAKAKMKEARNKRGPVSEETRTKMSDAHTGRIISWGYKISQSKKGIAFSEKHKKNISKGQSGRIRGPLTEKHKIKLSKVRKGKSLPKAHVDNLKGVKRTPKALANIVAAQRRRREREIEEKFKNITLGDPCEYK